MFWKPPRTIYSGDDKFRIIFQQSSNDYRVERYLDIEDFWIILGDFRSLNEAKEAADNYEMTPLGKLNEKIK